MSDITGAETLNLSEEPMNIAAKVNAIEKTAGDKTQRVTAVDWGKGDPVKCSTGEVFANTDELRKTYPDAQLHTVVWASAN